MAIRYSRVITGILLSGMGLTPLVRAEESSSPIVFTVAADTRKSKGNGPTSEHYESLELFQKVMNFVETQYVNEVDPKVLLYGAIKGMMDTLDPHSSFLTEEVFRDMKIDTSGKFGGLGLELGVKDNLLTVIAPYEDTPAWKAGLKPGDRITRIDGESTKGMSIADAVSRMRGKPGTQAKITVFRDSDKVSRNYVLVRDTIRIQSVKSEELEPGYGYVRLTSFNENAAADVKKAITKLETKGKLKGLVFDLRSNPGGLLDQAVDVTSLFVGEGVVVSTLGRDESQKEIKYARKSVAREDIQLAVLINSSTASAAEIVAGALQDHHRALILGQTSFGKGSVQSVVDLGKDLGLKLTIAQYYTPSGRSIQERGVVPDIVLEDYDPNRLADARRRSEALRERDLKGHIPNPQRKEFSEEELEVMTQGGSEDGTSSGAPNESGESKARVASQTPPSRLVPKEDYQVKEALSHLKSFEFFKRTLKAGTETASGGT